MNKTTTKFGLAAAVMVAGLMGQGQAFAEDHHHHHGHHDFLLGVSNGKVAVMHEHGGEVEDAHVFGAEMPNTYFTNAPGFNVEAAEYPAGVTAPVGNADVSFDLAAIDINGVTSNLFYWDGVGEVSFSAVTDGTTFTASKQINPFTSLNAVANGGSADVDGFVIGTTDADGGFHQHINFYMLDSSNGTSGIVGGIYAVALRLEQPGIEASDPVMIAFATEGIGEVAHKASVAYLTTALVPEPTSLLLLGLGGVALLSKRRGN